ncbi:MAG: hypothetical protein ACK5LJ_11105 [Paracoccus sp. (in: a-proteobacteria)]
MSSLFRVFSAPVLSLFILTAAQAQDIPPYQHQAERELCAAITLFETAGGTEIGQAEAEVGVTIADADFGEDGALYFRLNDPQTGPYIIASALTHSCNYSQQRHLAPIPFLAPPNSCHVIAASRRTLKEVNEFAAEHSAYLPQMNVFHARNGWYAISLGLVSSESAAHILRAGEGIPEDAYCADGANYFDIMERRDGIFSEPDPPAPVDPVERQAEAYRLVNAPESDSDPDYYHRACLLGNADGCGLYAEYLRSQAGEDETLRREAIRFDLIGCMLGEAISCHNANTDPNFGVETTSLKALPDRRGEKLEIHGLENKLRNLACDQDIAESCAALARPVIQYLVQNPGPYLTALAASFKACRQKGGYSCIEANILHAKKKKITGTGWSPMGDFIIAETLFEQCPLERKPNSSPCENAFLRFMGFRKSGAGTEDQQAIASLRFRDGCEAGNIRACAYLSRESDSFPLIDRRLASAKAIELCEAQSDPSDICENLALELGGDLPEAQEKIRERYDQLAMTCRSGQVDDSDNPCLEALNYWGAHISAIEIAEPLALLNETCRTGGPITGCDALYRIYDLGHLPNNDGEAGSWPSDPGKALATLKIGCKATLEAVGNCGNLGLRLEKDGDFTAAGEAYRQGCDIGMTAGEGQHYGQDRVCYWAAKNARVNLRDYGDARRWFRYGCFQGEDAFACKFLGLMEAQGEGGPVDPPAAIELYRRACYWGENITTGDGEACLFLAQTLIAERDSVARNMLIPEDEAVSDNLIMEVLALASDAFKRGCDDGISQSCQGTVDLLENWSRGDYPRADRQCWIVDATNQPGARKDCASFDIHLSANDERPSTIYIWPDRQRTIVSVSENGTRLNGAATARYITDGSAYCLRNIETGNAFCAQ